MSLIKNIQEKNFVDLKDYFEERIASIISGKIVQKKEDFLSKVRGVTEKFEKKSDADADADKDDDSDEDDKEEDGDKEKPADKEDDKSDKKDDKKKGFFGKKKEDKE